ncbi:MAG: DUF1570 domain-containing protein [Terriglobales bacterium]
MAFRLTAAALALASCVWASPKWVQVTSPHFVVVCDGGASEARHVAGQLERMREVFHQAFPDLRDPAAPLQVLAVQNRKEFDALEPAAYLGKGMLELAGYFQRTPERNLILLRLDASDAEGPYRTIYHEYTHLMTSGGQQAMPVWLSEGMAQFYESTEVFAHSANIGKPEAFNLDLLRRSRLMPLATLFAVDNTSPYYHEQDKASIFYAESWALTHMLLMRQQKNHTQEIANYLSLLRAQTPSATAAARAFGDLAQLQKDLSQYIERQSYTYVALKLSGKIDERQFAQIELPDVAADAVRGEFLAHNQRYADANALLATVLARDPGNVSAAESLGFIASQQGKLDDAARWYGKAVAGNSSSFLAQYDYAAITMRGDVSALDDATAAKVAASLESAIKLSPDFAPAYDRLAALKMERREDMDAAYRLELQAISLDPGAFVFRYNAAGILVEQQRVDDAIAALQRALPLASSAAETEMCQNRILEAQQYQRESQAFTQRRAQALAAAAAPPVAASAPLPASPPVIIRRESENPPPPSLPGRQQVLTGTIVGVRCSLQPGGGHGFMMDINLSSQGTVFLLHTDDFIKVPFHAANFTPSGLLNPCKDLQGLSATIRAAGTQIVSVTLRK